MIKNNKYFYSFVDLIDSAVSVKTQKVNRPGDYYELFYWSPDLPEIPIKQAHVVMNYLKKATANTEFMSKQKSDLAYKLLPDGTKLWLSLDGVHSLIYPTWNIDTFTVGKTKSVIFSSRDTWFFTEHARESSVKNFYNALQKMWTNLPDYWRNNSSDITQGTKLSYSKEYYLE
jgi:hypothetical protein